MLKASFNQLANVGNRFQGDAPRVLCVCSAGLLRSPTIASVLHKEYGCNVRAAGTSEEYALIPVSRALIAWAKLIVCADAEHEDYIRSELNGDVHQAPFICNLSLPDEYEYNDPVLYEIIKHKLEELTVDKYL